MASLPLRAADLLPSAPSNADPVKYAWVPHPLACEKLIGYSDACYTDAIPEAPPYRTVNNKYDSGLVSSIYHEIVEAITNPLGRAGW